MANWITSLRILCSIALLFCTACSPTFYVLYIAAGVTDMLDGWTARKTNTVSDFGAKLDTAADFVFVCVCFIKLLPVWPIEVWMAVWIAAIAVMKGLNILLGFITQKKMVVCHSVFNKMTGLLLFALPLTVSFIPFRESALAVCAVATLAAVQEGYVILTPFRKRRPRKNHSCG